MLILDIPILMSVLIMLYKIKLSPLKFLKLSVELVMDIMKFSLLCLKRFLGLLFCCCTCCKCCFIGHVCERIASYSKVPQSATEEGPLTVEEHEIKKFRYQRNVLVKGAIFLTYLSFFRVIMAVPHMMIVESDLRPVIRMQVTSPHGELYKDVLIPPELSSVEEYMKTYSEQHQGDEIGDQTTDLPRITATFIKSHWEDLGPSSLEQDSSEELVTRPSRLISVLSESQTKDVEEEPFSTPTPEILGTGTLTTSVPDTTNHHTPKTYIEKNDHMVKVVTVFDISEYEDVEADTEHHH